MNAKELHEEFVRNPGGFTTLDTVVAIFHAPAAVLLLKMAQNRSPPSFIRDVACLVLPLLASVTTCASVGLYSLCFILAMAAVIRKNRKRGDAEAADRAARDQENSNKKTFISLFKGSNLLLTIICILAVDFPIFPRRFAKTDGYGVSLMDVGVGTFVVSSALTSSFARAVSSLSSTSFSSSSTAANTAAAATTATAANASGDGAGRLSYWKLAQRSVVLFLGVCRMALLRWLNYQDSPSEYGTHWNFFVTLFFVWTTADLLHAYLGEHAVAVLALVIAVVYQYLLVFSPLTDFILHAPRTSFLSSNREGLCSLLGFIPLYLLAEYLARRFIYRVAVVGGSDSGDGGPGASTASTSAPGSSTTSIAATTPTATSTSVSITSSTANLISCHVSSASAAISSVGSSAIASGGSGGGGGGSGGCGSGADSGGDVVMVSETSTDVSDTKKIMSKGFCSLSSAITSLSAVVDSFDSVGYLRVLAGLDNYSAFYNTTANSSSGNNSGNSNSGSSGGSSSSSTSHVVSSYSTSSVSSLSVNLSSGSSLASPASATFPLPLKYQLQIQSSRILNRLSIGSVSLWLLYVASSTVQPASRRLTNLPFAIFILALTCSLLTSFLIVDLTGTAAGARVLTVEYMNTWQLPLFLIANLLTGLVNLSTTTRLASDIVAFLVLFVYTSVVCLCAWLLAGPKA